MTGFVDTLHNKGQRINETTERMGRTRVYRQDSPLAWSVTPASFGALADIDGLRGVLSLGVIKAGLAHRATLGVISDLTPNEGKAFAILLSARTLMCSASSLRATLSTTERNLLPDGARLDISCPRRLVSFCRQRWEAPVDTNLDTLFPSPVHHGAAWASVD